MTDDERQADAIIRRWIHKKTGVSEAERAMRKIGDAFRSFGAAIQKAFDPLGVYTIDKLGKEGQ